MEIKNTICEMKDTLEGIKSRQSRGYNQWVWRQDRKKHPVITAEWRKMQKEQG